MIHVAILIVAALAALPQFTTILQFDDGTVDVCLSHGWQYDGVTLTVQVQGCRTDSIFRNGFEWFR